MRNPAISLIFLRVNQVWTFTFGDSLLRLDGERMFFQTKDEAKQAAHRHGISIPNDHIHYWPGYTQ